MSNVLRLRPMADRFREFQLELCERIGCQADSRDRKAVASPENCRNERSARALRVLAERVRGLPEYHPALRGLWRLHFAPRHSSTPSLDSHPELFIVVERGLLQAYGFRKQANGDPEAFLAEYAKRLKQELAASEQ